MHAEENQCDCSAVFAQVNQELGDEVVLNVVKNVLSLFQVDNRRSNEK